MPFYKIKMGKVCLLYQMLYLVPMINKLPENVISQIAAGEIIDRPAQIVKELVENSLDAKASKVHLNFSDGGRDILIKDDGIGVSQKGLSLILDRYSTSKISNIDDLWNLDSFGFRGEALHSIASVSMFSITSKTKDKGAFNVTSAFGKLSPIVKSHGDKGTLISAKKLFETLPARLKFLKSNRAESMLIKKTFKALALINFKTEFKLSQDSELIDIYSQKNSLYERAKEILKQEELYHVKKTINGFDIEVCFSSPNNTQKTSQNIWIFAQDRWVQDRTIQAAMMESYRTLLMHRQFPVVVLSIKCKKDEIDINIHPTKSQVKFLRQSEVFNSVVQTLRPALQNSPWLSKVLSSKTQVKKTAQVTTGFKGDTFNTASFAKRNFSEVSKWPKSSEITSAFSSNIEKELIPKKEPQWQGLDIIGQCNCTYIITQSRNSLILIDQHAAHERVLYEKLNLEFSTGNIKIQNNLIPIKITLDNDKISILKSQDEFFKKLGLYLSFNENFIEVLSGPVILNKISIESGIKCILNDIEVSSGSTAPIEENVSNIFATMACYSAIRAGKILSDLEIKALLKQMDEFSLSSFCPHGRPVYIEYPFTKLDTEFCRTV